LRDYELVVIISPSVTDDGVSATIEKINQFISERSGSTTEVNQWGMRKLAYPIKDFTEGHYVLTQFKMDPKLTAELEASLELWDEVLRHLLVRLLEIWALTLRCVSPPAATRLPRFVWLPRGTTPPLKGREGRRPSGLR
jgi:small subunit ribosomal protein S6